MACCSTAGFHHGSIMKTCDAACRPRRTLSARRDGRLRGGQALQARMMMEAEAAAMEDCTAAVGWVGGGQQGYSMRHLQVEPFAAGCDQEAAAG